MVSWGLKTLLGNMSLTGRYFIPEDETCLRERDFIKLKLFFRMFCMREGDCNGNLSAYVTTPWRYV